MEPDKTMLITALFEILGYHPGPRKEDLEKDLQKFLLNYQASGNPIPWTQDLSTEAVDCASSFLHEGQRAEKYWPATFRNVVSWPTDRKW
ncbi:uncharacterized protein LY89DRAFT_742908 [Mollisia scopiformis]|uniref:Uncharacterized protein n=1 Tax=Mollisia scopiformis TaxID=149040 RepID=A0A132B4D7_MOLSC|nr:uncharacterized protein LY89DRAFT_742908 [Mollisia scopiformis]KUJ07260.1 hypothetical protein LY89DRAFT_742908 [Mollisia scopiformis]